MSQYQSNTSLCKRKDIRKKPFCFRQIVRPMRDPKIYQIWYLSDWEFSDSYFDQIFLVWVSERRDRSFSSFLFMTTHTAEYDEIENYLLVERERDIRESHIAICIDGSNTSVTPRYCNEYVLKINSQFFSKPRTLKIKSDAYQI